jgi:hypothetical protein
MTTINIILMLPSFGIASGFPARPVRMSFTHESNVRHRLHLLNNSNSNNNNNNNNKPNKGKQRNTVSLLGLFPSTLRTGHESPSQLIPPSQSHCHFHLELHHWFHHGNALEM